VRRLDAALLVGALLGFVAVAAGAMGAHALRERLDVQALEWWKTAAQYAQIHAAVIVAIALGSRQPRARVLGVAWVAFAIGIAVFSGTLCAMALGGPRWLGAVTPIGGLCLLGGWLALGFAGWRARGRTGPADDGPG
jgi:uncharacterized membrane protein YgdD (TMEM256/DUF423 family)